MLETTMQTSYPYMQEPSNDGISSYSENNKDGTTKLRDDTQDDKTSEQHATVAVFNEEKKCWRNKGAVQRTEVWILSEEKRGGYGQVTRV